MHSYPHKTAYRSFPFPVSLVPYLKQVEGQKASLYSHTPFCSHKCGYCNLFSLQINCTDYIATYLGTLHKQAQQLPPLTIELVFDSFTIKGGTSLLLTVPQLEHLLDIVALFGVHPSRTSTSAEISPEYADPARLDLPKQVGVARVSTGVQSSLDEELTALKRHPRRDMINQVLEVIRKRQLPLFNTDLIYGTKGQIVANLPYPSKQALLFQPGELFIYPLYVRPGTAITGWGSDDVCFQTYHATRDLLGDKGFLQTSIRCFIHYPSTDAEVLCRDEVILSCGSGGCSCLGNLYYATWYTVCQHRITGEIDDYMGITDSTVARNGFIFSQEERRQCFIIKNLMCYMGLDKAEYKRRFGELPDNVLLLQQLAEQQWIENTDNGHICLASDGMVYSDHIGQLFIIPEIKELMETYSY